MTTIASAHFVKRYLIDCTEMEEVLGKIVKQATKQYYPALVKTVYFPSVTHHTSITQLIFIVTVSWNRKLLEMEPSESACEGGVGVAVVETVSVGYVWWSVHPSPSTVHACLQTNWSAQTPPWPFTTTYFDCTKSISTHCIPEFLCSVVCAMHPRLTIRVYHVSFTVKKQPNDHEHHCPSLSCCGYSSWSPVPFTNLSLPVMMARTWMVNSGNGPMSVGGDDNMANRLSNTPPPIKKQMLNHWMVARLGHPQRVLDELLSLHRPWHLIWTGSWFPGCCHPTTRTWNRALPSIMVPKRAFLACVRFVWTVKAGTNWCDPSSWQHDHLNHHQLCIISRSHAFFHCHTHGLEHVNYHCEHACSASSNGYEQNETNFLWLWCWVHEHVLPCWTWSRTSCSATWPPGSCLWLRPWQYLRGKFK